MGFFADVTDGCGCLFALNLGLLGLGLCGTDMWIGGVIILIIVVVYYLIYSTMGSGESASSSPSRQFSQTPPSKKITTSRESAEAISFSSQHPNDCKTMLIENSEPQINPLIDPSLRLAITKNLSPAKKINHESFRQELLGHGIRCFYHFTDVRNLENIRKYGGLISWSSCKTHDVEIPSAGGSDFSRRLDMRYNLQDYVRLSFCNDHPMAYRLKQESKTLVLLKIHIDVAEWEGTLFSNINATDVGHSHGGTLSDLQKIRWAAVKRNYVSREDEDFKYHQAEILVKTAIPKEFIVNLDNPIYL